MVIKLTNNLITMVKQLEYKNRKTKKIVDDGD
jgi:hypothetical protein